MNTGDVILYRTNFCWYKPMTWLSAAIRLFTGVKYNHVAVIVSNWERLFINEANQKGVITNPIEAKLERNGNEYIVLKPIFNINEREFAIRANGKIGTKYDYFNLIFQQVHYRIFKWWLGKDIAHEGKRMVCSEYVAYCFEPFADGFEDWYKWSAKEFLESKNFMIKK